MWPWILITIYCFFVALASLAGGALPSRLRLSHTSMQLVMSLVGGLVLGVGLLHLLPHSFAETGSLDTTVWAALIGLLAMFFLIRTFHVHQHGPVETSEPDSDEHDHCDEHHDHNYPTDGEHCATHRHPYSWIGLCVGLTLHTLIDGMALAAAVSAQALHADNTTALLGFGTFLAVLLHKPLDAMSITTVMVAGGWSPRWQRVINIAFAMMCAAGAASFLLGIGYFAAVQHTIVGWALGFAAGVFLCISLADVLPEVQFHAHDRGKLSAALIAGVALAYAIGFLEPAHQHEQPGPNTGHAVTESSGHEDHDHGQASDADDDRR